MRGRGLACLAVVAAAGLSACGSVAAPATISAHGRGDSAPAAADRLPAGNRAEATALASLLLTRLRLPAGARRLPSFPVPQRLREPMLDVGAYAELDLHQLFELPEAMGQVAATLAATRQTGMDLSATGGPGGPPGGASDFMDVSFADRSLPSGIYTAQLVLTIVPTRSGGSLLRADAQVEWFPPRSPAEYIDPARYRVLTITVQTAGSFKLRKVVTSRAAISRLAAALNRSPVQPVDVFSCPMIFAQYQLAFSVSVHGKPVFVVGATESPCEGARITVGGRPQPSLQDEAAVVAMADWLLGVTPASLLRHDG